MRRHATCGVESSGSQTAGRARGGPLHRRESVGLPGCRHASGRSKGASSIDRRRGRGGSDHAQGPAARRWQRRLPTRQLRVPQSSALRPRAIGYRPATEKVATHFGKHRNPRSWRSSILRCSRELCIGCTRRIRPPSRRGPSLSSDSSRSPDSYCPPDVQSCSGHQTSSSDRTASQASMSVTDSQ